MQLSVVEFARHVVGYNDAHSIELDPNTTHPVIALLPEQDGIEDIGGTLRLVYWINLPWLISFTVKKRFMNVIVIVMNLTTITAKCSQKTA